METVIRTTATEEPDLADDSAFAKSQVPRRKFFAPFALAMLPREVSADATVIQIWEGTVIDVNYSEGVMQVLLEAKIGQIPRHTGEIDLEWVSDQDRDLIRPGAVFYLTLFKRTKRGSIENAQELRFRRCPAWSTMQITQIERDADMLLSKMKARPTVA